MVCVVAAVASIDPAGTAAVGAVIPGLPAFQPVVPLVIPKPATPVEAAVPNP